ncbi:VWA domain-containing protein [Leucobacter sp. BZR 635]
MAAAVVYTGLPTAAFAAVEPDPTESALQQAVTDAPAELTPGEEPAETPAPEQEPGGENTGAPAPGVPEEGEPEAPAEPEVEAPVEEAPQAEGLAPLAAPAPKAAPLAASPNSGPGTGTAPGKSEVLIRVSAMGDRLSPSGSIGNLAGATFGAYEATSLTKPTNTTPSATCTTDSSGKCWMKVPTRGSSNKNGYIVRADATPTGWSALPELNLEASESEPYSYYTGATASGGSVSSRTFTYPTVETSWFPSDRQSSGKWASARTNPQLDAVCGVDVALLVDLSSSVTSSALTQIRAASKSVIDALTGTPSKVAIQTFGTSAPANNTTGNNNAFMPLRSVATQAEADVVLRKAQGIAVPNNQKTNWDQGFWSLNEIADDGELDMVIMITDGLPTTFGSGSDGSNSANFERIENSVASANALKSHGVGIIAVGVGDGISGSAENLRAISGPVAGKDYYQVKNWNDLAAQMKALSSKNCEGTVNVVKQVIPAGGTIDSAAPRASWGFTATAPAATVRTDVKDSSFATSAQGVTGNTGAIGFRSSFEGTSEGQRKLSISEELTPQYSIAKQDGKNAVCVRTDTKKPVPVTNTGTATNPGFTVDPIQNATVSCVVYNQALDLSAKLRVDKVWKIDADGDGKFEETTQANTAPQSLPGLNASLQLTDNASLPGGSVNFGQTLSDLGLNSTVRVSESVTGLPALCTNTATFTPALSDGLTKLTKTSKQGVNEVTLTNTVTCEQPKLTLEKQLSHGQTPVTDWTLDAIAPEGALAGPSGKSGHADATAPVTAGTNYALAEAPGTPEAEGYTQQWAPTEQADWAANHEAGATGSWECVAATSVKDGVPTWGTSVVDGANGGVSVEAGEWLKCAAVNDPKPTLELVKQVQVGDELQTVELGDDRWTLSATWAAPDAADAITPFPGEQQPLQGAGGVKATHVLPGHYSLSESAEQNGFDNGTAFSCVVNDGDPQLIAAGSDETLALAAGDNAVCTIVNTAKAAPLTVEKSDGKVVQLEGGLWQIDYDIAVKNDSPVPSSYTLEDTLKFGTGFSVRTASWINEGGAPSANTPIKAHSTDTYTFRVIASFDKTVENPQLTCDAETGGAFFNTAHISFPGGEDSDNACAEPGSPTVVKTALPVTQNSDGTWAVSYEIVVTNGSKATVAYDLTETVSAMPPGATLVQVDSVSSTGGSLKSGWNGSGVLVGNLTLRPGGVHTSTVVLRVKVDATASPEALVCDTAGNAGVWNTATVANHFDEPSSQACASIEIAKADVEKQVSKVIQLDNGSWQVTYDVIAKNQSSKHKAIYNLSDELRFGGGITVTEASWAGPGDATGSFATDGTATLATNRALAAGGTEKYSVTVLATIDQAAWSAEDSALTCDVDGEAGGFLNTAAITAAGVTEQASACDEPKLPKITKKAVGAVQDPTDPDLWLVSYELRVKTGGFGSAYTLSDTPAFAPGITLGAGTAQRTDTDPAGDAVAITSGAPFGDTPVKIGADDKTHTWLVTWEARLGDAIPAEQRVCGEPGSGLFNTANLIQGDEVTGGDTACLPAPERVQPKASKQVAKAVQGPNGDWAIDYDLVVKLPKKGEKNPDGLSANYTLSDTLAYGGGIDVQSASWTGPGSAAGDFTAGAWSADIAQGATIAAGDTHRYRVTVVASVTAAAVEAGTTECLTDGEAGGFLNTAKLVSAGTPTLVEACAEPKLPTIEKTAVGAVQDETDPELWHVMYQLTVTGSGFDSSYTLTDTPDFADGVVLGKGTAQRADTEPVGDAFEITAGDPFKGGPVKIGADDKPHTWLVTWEAHVGNDMPADQQQCEGPGTGFFNSATLTQGDTVIGDGSVCLPVQDRVYPGVTKTVVDVAQGPSGDWNVGYELVVTLPAQGETNPSGLSAKYDLSDALAFGEGIDVKSASWTGPGNAKGDFSGTDWSAAIAKKQAIQAGDTHTYRVSVTAAVPPKAIDDGGATCSEGGEAGGFLNTAELVSGAVTTPVQACAEPALPKITKSAVGAEQDAEDPDLWHVSYKLAVATGGFDSSYTLSDTPDFANGVTLGDGTAKRTDTDPQGRAFAIESGKPFASEPVKIGAEDRAHTWLVTWEARVDNDVTAEASECAGPGKGFFNTAELTQGDTVAGDDGACIPVPERAQPTVSKKVVKTIQDPDGLWKISYDLVVKNPDALAAKYELTDTLAFGDGIDVKSASWTGPNGKGDFSDTKWNADIAAGTLIAAGDTHTYRVTVAAEVTPKAIEAGTTACLPEGKAGGFLNTAKLVSGGASTPAGACAEPLHPTIEKTGGKTVDNGDGTFDLDYEIKVKYPETDARHPVGVSFTLQDEPQMPKGVETVGGWSAEAATAATPQPQNPRSPVSGEWTIVQGAQFTPDTLADGITEFVYRVTATVKVSPIDAPEAQVCEDTGETGILIPNIGRIVSGGFIAEDSGCQAVNFSDVSITKAAGLAEGETSVAPGDTFDYVLTVTNHGTEAAKNVKVTDNALNDRLKITGLTVGEHAAWGPAPGYTGNKVELTLDEIPVGESVEVRISVEFMPAAVLQAEPILSGAPTPDAPAALDELTNTACVEMAGDANADNNCAEVQVPVRDLTATVYTLCVADAPMLGWSVEKSELLKEKPVNFRWTPDAANADTKPAEVSLVEPGGSTNWNGTETWPGSAFTPSGISVDYPGWRTLRLSDMAPGGGYLLPGTTTVMTAEQASEYVFNGLILDPSELDYSWRGDTTIQFSVNPELTFNASYPPATAGCGAARHAQVEIAKDASVDRIEAGKSFDYTLAVQNVSDDSAAEGVVVTDEIPAGLKVTDVTWAGKDLAGTFPNWSECDVTGQSSGGYGGTLSCELFGPLQPKGSSDGASQAPVITLSVTVDPQAKSAGITNTATVDYHTFGDPKDAGKHSDDAAVQVTALPGGGGHAGDKPRGVLSATGAQVGGLLGSGIAVLLLGAGALLWARRRKQHAAE